MHGQFASHMRILFSVYTVRAAPLGMISMRLGCHICIFQMMMNGILIDVSCVSVPESRAKFEI
jgi:hypothetical protein